jgi:DNA-binding XRE family transcriptional regulator
VQPRALRESYEWWQDICLDIRERRFTLEQEQEDVAQAAGIALNTFQRMERGQWVGVLNLFLVCSVLGLRVEQVVPVRRRRAGRSRPSAQLRRRAAR